MTNKKATELADTKTVALTDKEFFCLSWHHNAFYEQSKQGMKADWGKPCSTCKYNEDCYSDGSKPLLYELEKKMPVQIIHFKHDKDIFSYGEGFNKLP